MTLVHHDVLIIGPGAAGLTAALALADTKRLLVLAKGDLRSGSTAWAQGGIAAGLDSGDTCETTIRDTMVPGAGPNQRAERRTVGQQGYGRAKIVGTRNI